MQVSASYSQPGLYQLGLGYIETLLKKRPVSPPIDPLSVSTGHDRSVLIMLNAIRMHHALEQIGPVLIDPQQVGAVSSAGADSPADILSDSQNSDTGGSSDRFSSSTIVSGADVAMLETMVNIAAESMNALFDDSILRSSPSAMLEQVREDVRTAVLETFGANRPAFDDDLGIHFDFSNPNEGVFNFSQKEQLQLGNALKTPQGLASVRDIFLGGASGGLLGRLHAVTTVAGSNLAKEVGSTGLFLDTIV